MRRSTGAESRGDKLWWNFPLADLSASSHCGWQSLSCPCRFYCSGNVTYALLYIPLYFKHILPLRSAEHKSAALTFIDVWRIHKTWRVRVGNRSSLLKTDISYRTIQTVGRLMCKICFLSKGLSKGPYFKYNTHTKLKCFMQSKYIIKNPEGFSVSSIFSSWQGQKASKTACKPPDILHWNLGWNHATETTASTANATIKIIVIIIKQ